MSTALTTPAATTDPEAVTLEDLAAQDPAWTPERVRDRLLESLGLPAGPLAAAVPAFDPAALPRDPWVFTGL